MVECSIQNCSEQVSEILNTRGELERWIRLRACQCGAWDSRNRKACECKAPEDAKIPTSYWPHLDWWMFGGVEEVVLCPLHRFQVLQAISLERTLDPSMDSSHKPDPSNRH